MTHELKILPKYFRAVDNGSKLFEIRKNDRDFHEGDIVILNEWNPDDERYTDRSINKVIGFITDYAQKEDYVVFSLIDLKNSKFYRALKESNDCDD